MAAAAGLMTWVATMDWKAIPTRTATAVMVAACPTQKPWAARPMGILQLLASLTLKTLMLLMLKMLKMLKPLTLLTPLAPLKTRPLKTWPLKTWAWLTGVLDPLMARSVTHVNAW
jgi:hypothetical protein